MQNQYDAQAKITQVLGERMFSLLHTSTWVEAKMQIEHEIANSFKQIRNTWDKNQTESF